MDKFIFVSLLVLFIISLAESFFNDEYQALRIDRFNCNFDYNTCGWRNDRSQRDDFNWQRGAGRRGVQSGSGTRRDHTGGTGGSYMYIRSKNRGNRTARLLSPRINIPTNGCFQFWYYMKGRTLGHLEVLLLTGNNSAPTETVLWNLRGHQANQWLKANIPILGKSVPQQLVIEAFDWERGRSGNIAIDDVALVSLSSLCPSIIPPYAAPSTAESPTGSIPTIYNLTTSSSAVSYTQNINYSNTSTNQTQSRSTSYLPSTATIRSTATTRTQSFTTTAHKSIQKASLQTLLSTSTTASQNLNLLYPTKSTQTQSSNIGTAIGITFGLLAAVVLLVALTIYFRNNIKNKLTYNDKCSVLMTKMHPDVTVNTNISFQNE